MKAVAISHPNIALAKYWGKRDDRSKDPAVPSLSVTLRGLTTKTSVELDASLPSDELWINGREARGESLARAVSLLNSVSPLRKQFARILSTNDFPTASGLASSASGFSALALAASHVFGASLSKNDVSLVARKASASAARSLFGGFAELVPGHAARQVTEQDHLPMAVLVCVTSEKEKHVGSSQGMQITRDVSPYYAAWLDEAPRIYAGIREALLRRDFEALGELSERSALAMHASAIAAGVCYWNGATLAAYQAVRDLRQSGISAWASMDAGPHVKVFVEERNADLAAAQLRLVDGVLRVIDSGPGPGAELVES